MENTSKSESQEIVADSPVKKAAEYRIPGVSGENRERSGIEPRIGQRRGADRRTRDRRKQNVLHSILRNKADADAAEATYFKRVGPNRLSERRGKFVGRRHEDKQPCIVPSVQPKKETAAVVLPQAKSQDTAQTYPHNRRLTKRTVRPIHERRAEAESYRATTLKTPPIKDIPKSWRDLIPQWVHDSAEYIEALPYIKPVLGAAKQFWDWFRRPKRGILNE